MAGKTFAAIDVGSFEIEMKIFEISNKKGMKQIDDLRHRLDLGSETYETGKLSVQKVEELCKILKSFAQTMKTYRVDDYRAYGTSAIREMRGTQILIDQIEQRTGIHIDVLSNSEQRFLDYKSVASKTEEFHELTQDGAILDIGGDGVQLSLFEDGKLTATQNMRLGVLRLNEALSRLDAGSYRMEQIIEEIVMSQLDVFRKLYLKERKIRNLIVVDDYFSAICKQRTEPGLKAGYVRTKVFERFTGNMMAQSTNQVAEQLDIPEENARLLLISCCLLRHVVAMMDTQMIWAPGVTLCDGIVYEYADKNKLIRSEHDFEADILSSAMNIRRRYMGSRKRGETLEQITLTVFDSMKKVHGLGRRERLLLQLSAILHDCGKYISMINLAECSYNIVMSTEIIGLSHREREIIANVVKYNHMPFDYDALDESSSGLDRETELTIAKLTAILRIANGLDRSHKQKFKNVKTQLKEDRLEVIVETGEDITLEKGLFRARADFFEEIFAIRPVIRQKRIF
ncbi:MAG: exopolyphosphatase [Lachnospiraceae bacterium]|nr:exopolyphosphatase [Lachnospiraceae bacterium]